MNRLLLILFIATITCATVVAQTQTAPTGSNGQRKSEPAQAATTKPSTSSQASNRSDIKEEDCGCEGKTPSDAFATVNGVKITDHDINEQTRVRINELRQQVVAARKRELDLQINSKLLAAEAKKRGISETKLIEEEIVAKVKEPTEAEALAFYEKNRGRIQGDFKDVKSGIISHLRNQRQGEEAKKFADRMRAASQVKVLVNKVIPPLNDSERARILATVNSQPINSGDIEDSLRPLIFHVQQQVYDLRKYAIDLKINDLLLEQEAQKRKITTQSLLDAELAPKVKKITEDDARKFYEGNKERLMGDFAQLKGQIMQYLQQREVGNAETILAEQLRRSASLQLFLKAPAPPVYAISTDDRPFKGNPTAPVTIIVFTDFECQSCARAHPVIEKLVQEYGDKVKLVVRDFPLAQHTGAFRAAEAAEAAREQGKYWEYFSILMQNQSALGIAKLKEYATQVGVDRKKFDAALDSGKFAGKVQRDIHDGLSFGINSTPTIFVNGQQVMEKSYEALKAAIEAALKNTVAKNG